MIENITIKNFQSHAKFKIDFDPNITTIIGPNDTGKTAIIRALRWLCFNRPSGNAFIRRGSSSARVLLVVDGHNIQRKRGKSINVYSIDEKEYKAMGSEVPSPVSDLLQVNELNFQSQHDAPFWFSLTPAQVAKELNQVVDLSIIDESLYRIGARVREARTIADHSKARLSEAKARRNELKWIKDAHADYLNVCTLKDTLLGGAENRAKLSVLVASARKHAKRAQTHSIASEGAKQAYLIGRSVATIAARREKLNCLYVHACKLVQKTPINAPDLAYLTETLEENKTKQQSLQNLIKKAEKWTEQIFNLAKEISKYESKLKEFKTCPTCNQPMVS